ncbi:MAG: cell wall-binding repeat-containing protein [Tissierella sp.]|uniref:cell wall-binding repeat-containing protein n=1 Tax=Tissierella sp. TaxID=41274 RepID=UPI003F9C90B1
MRRFKRVVIFTVLFFCILNNRTNAEKQEPVVKRLEGKNRIETSISVSKEAFKRAKTAIVVGYTGEVDALTGTILARKKDAPILMSHKNRLDTSLVKELKRLEAKEVFIIGGESIVEPIVEKELKNLGLAVNRIKGKTREETAINVSKESIKSDSKEAFLTLGYGVYADALAIGPIAANKNVPLLLTNKDKLKQETLDYLKSSGIKTVTIVGGENAVSKKVEKTLKSLDINVKRIEGKGREDTAIRIAEEYIKNPGKIILANGYKYADAVVGGYLGAKENSPILLNNDKALNYGNEKYIKEKGLSTTVLGGNLSIGDTVFRNIELGLGIIKEDNKEPGDGDRFFPSFETMPNSPQSLKEVMKEKLEDFEADISIVYEGRISSDEVRGIIRDIYSDGSYIGGAIKSITPGVKKVGDSSEVVLKAEYYNTKKEEAFMDTEINKILGKIIKPGMNEFQKVKAVHDHVVNNTRYSNDTIKTSHSAYAALTEGKAVCQGYALLTYRFLDALDIENHYVIGDTLGKKGWGLHAWNKVKINGKYYNIDTTKDDPIVVDGNHILSYKYFLVSDKKFSATHRPNRDIFPKATDTKYEALSNAYNPFEYKNSLYFGNTNDKDKLYSVDLDSFKVKKLSSNRAPYLVVAGNKIYFSNYSSGGHIYSSDLNGKNLKQLNKVHSTHLKLEGSYIKFFNKTIKKWDKLKIK